MRLLLLEDVLVRRHGRYESAMRAWALHDAKAAKVVRRSDRKRLAHVTGLFEGMGFPEAEARASGLLSVGKLRGPAVIVNRVSAPTAWTAKFVLTIGSAM